MLKHAHFSCQNSIKMPKLFLPAADTLAGIFLILKDTFPELIDTNFGH